MLAATAHLEPILTDEGGRRTVSAQHGSTAAQQAAQSRHTGERRTRLPTNSPPRKSISARRRQPSTGSGSGPAGTIGEGAAIKQAVASRVFRVFWRVRKARVKYKAILVKGNPSLPHHLTPHTSPFRQLRLSIPSTDVLEYPLLGKCVSSNKHLF